MPLDDVDGLVKLRRHVRILVDLGRLAGEETTLSRFLDQACVQVARAIEIDHVKALRYRHKTADLFIEAGFGWKDGVVGLATFPADLRSPPGRTYQTGEPVVIVDGATAQQRGDFVFSEVLKEHNIKSLANVPILVKGAAWGVLEVDSTVTREFGDDTIAFLMAAAAVISSTLQRPTASADAQSTAAAIGQVEEREVLLREMQHRVKNNFQLILASIAIQKRRFESAEVHRVLEHVANRVNAISLAHDQLSPGQDLRAVNVANYLRALCASLQAQMENATIEINADEVELAMERAVPLGLILNEAVMNSVKHAFGTGKGNINVSLQSGVGYGEARLTLADDGHGVRNPRPGGSGQKLIQALSRQIGGTAELLSSDKGTTVTVVFPVIA
ncbi:sensor histidine kinase [Mesorhizobium humile]|uniref:histidine kinase n=1 Tax=Mesorhizobium humile TaxID=3072313 RepID=A0ABU4YPK0_9HYPH|nr:MULTISPECIES: histidine kinase dimerization/phosphoacceptor domain -containing protein [unclassified Mesorhizobium]MDX8457936.1 histidine kinase dimerization/phosphoacceptor domain -containing protein [Mesorhizobium sp. VK2D]MDX8488015.1 histidine kinase dimerization/phosphoacceptor domain -containing protein [Mesorhizobium sp. VK2B]